MIFRFHSSPKRQDIASVKHEDALLAGLEEDIRLYFDEKVSDEEFGDIAAEFNQRFPELAEGFCQNSAMTVRAWREEADVPEKLEAPPLAPARRLRVQGVVPGAVSSTLRVSRKTSGVFGMTRRVFSSKYLRVAAVWTYV